MGNENNALLNQLHRAGTEAYKSGLYRQAATLFLRGAELARENGEQSRRLEFLFWAGTSLFLAGSPAEAVPLLLEVVQQGQADGDIADVYNAFTSLIDLALRTRPRAEILTLLQDARAYLERVGRENWRHKLLYLEAKLEIRRGEGRRALELAKNSLALWQGGYPSYVKSVHLFVPGDAAFQLRNHEELAAWVDSLQNNEPAGEGCRLFALRALLLLARATGENVQAPAVAELARSLARRLDSVELPAADAWIEVGRTLLVFGGWLETERTFARVTPGDDEDRFDLAMARADLNLGQAREKLGLPRRDEEWHSEPEYPAGPFPGGAAALPHLVDARSGYEAAWPFAVLEDSRLETRFFHHQLESRLAKVQALEAALRREGI